MMIYLFLMQPSYPISMGILELAGNRGAASQKGVDTLF